jgi:hypothetical protein
MMSRRSNYDLQIIEEEIENALDIYLAGFYKTAFGLPELHQQLRHYVLQELTKSYRIRAKDSNTIIKDYLPYHSLELRLELEKYTEEGIFKMVEENKGIRSLALSIELIDSEKN